ncbi:PKD domain-containing protein [Carboxylicivirga taeanensis]|uniref:PKD domain-containing protein n=1 Tax=Carboxylicivirga taeanensis TaxID=1416875 RepID=UPI003F6E040F
MKNIIKSGIAFLMAAFLLLACDPQEFDKPDLNMSTPPNEEDLSFTVAPGDDEFHFVLTSTTETKGVNGISWDFGNGGKATGQQVIANYNLPGEYEVVMTITGGNGASVSTKKVVEQTETNYALFENPIVLALTGGIENPTGHTWVVDSTSKWHFGVGAAFDDSGNVLNEPNWWGATSLAKTGHYIYDDEFTFIMDEFKYIIDTKGATHANNDGGAAEAGLAAGYYTSNIWNDNFDMDVTTDDAARGDLQWGFKEVDGKSYITLSSQSGVIGYDDGLAREYEVLDWNENYFFLRTTNGEAARYNKIIRKGYVPPVIEKPLETNDIMDDFEGNGNIEWNKGDLIKFESISNFAPVPINESANIALYQKGEGPFEAVTALFEHRFDLSERNVFTMKVFMPQFNDYITECQPDWITWIPNKQLLPQVDLKLQNSELGGEAWTTQEVRTVTLTEDQLGKWVEVTFDFSNISDRTDFDMIVIQFGMEGHCNGGIFYLDDFMLN